MAKTHTGSFPIGFRRGGGEWQRELGSLIKYAKDQKFEGLDVGPIPAEELKQITAAGLRIGTIDLKQWGDLASADAGKRKAAAQENAAYIKMAAGVGAKTFFIVVLPEDPTTKRSQILDQAVDGYGQLSSAVASTGAKIVIEGWPGPGPNFPALACTTADYRLFFKEVGGEVLGVNFDPSHLIRMFIDPVRFLGEFAPRVHHVHGKDTEIFHEALYEHGTLQAATREKSHGFGQWYWRYTIPGQGEARWRKMFSILKDAGYKGMVSIELEDENYNGSEQGEKSGLEASRDFLVCT